MMNRRSFIAALASLPLVGKLLIQSPVQEGWRDVVHPFDAYEAVMAQEEFKPTYFPAESSRARSATMQPFDVRYSSKWPVQMRSADGYEWSSFEKEETAHKYLKSMFAMDWYGLGKVTCWAKLTGGTSFHEVGPPFTSMAAAQEWMSGLTISKGE